MAAAPDIKADIPPLIWRTNIGEDDILLSL
jgi:hypothetical protein